jgi:hypothetical protein
MALENRTWGAEPIRRELLKLGIEVAKSTIQKYIRTVRGSMSAEQTWSTFLRNHAKDILACDFLQTYDLFFRTIFVVIELESRRLVHFRMMHPVPKDVIVATGSVLQDFDRLWMVAHSYPEKARLLRMLVAAAFVKG